MGDFTTANTALETVVVTFSKVSTQPKGVEAEMMNRMEALDLALMTRVRYRSSQVISR